MERFSAQIGEILGGGVGHLFGSDDDDNEMREDDDSEEPNDGSGSFVLSETIPEFFI